MAVALMALSLLAPIPAPSDPPPPPLAGTWSQYGRSPSDGQRWYHREVTGLLRGDYEAYIAVVDCELVGREAWIQVWPWKRWLHSFIYDCSGHSSTTRWMRENGILGELDYYTARKLGVPQGRGVTGAITFAEPLEVNDVLDSVGHRGMGAVQHGARNHSMHVQQHVITKGRAR